MPASRRAPHFALPGESIFCPNGHELDDAWVAGDSPMLTQRCGFKYPPGNAGTCEMCIYWLQLPGGFRIVVEVASSEAFEMQSKRMNIEQLLNYLGLRWQKKAA